MPLRRSSDLIGIVVLQRCRPAGAFCLPRHSVCATAGVLSRLFTLQFICGGISVVLALSIQPWAFLPCNAVADGRVVPFGTSPPTFIYPAHQVNNYFK